MTNNVIKISVYINEGDTWNHRPLHLEILRMLYVNGLAGGTVLRAIAGFTKTEGVVSATLVDVSGNLPLKIEFIDSVEKIESILPELMKMAGHRLIVREPTEIVNLSAYITTST